MFVITLFGKAKKHDKRQEVWLQLIFYKQPKFFYGIFHNQIDFTQIKPEKQRDNKEFTEMKNAFTYLTLLLVASILQEKASRVEAFQPTRSNLNQCRQDRTISRSTFTRPKCVDTSKSIHSQLRMAESDTDFWQQQRELMNDLSDSNEKSLQEENRMNFAKVQTDLIVESLFITTILFSILWLVCDNPFVPLSYVFGSAFGTAYAYGLGKYVESVGGTIDDAAAVEGAGVGQARFAFLIMLFIFVGKFRAYGLLEIPSIMGFFTYQLASLSQGLKEEKIE